MRLMTRASPLLLLVLTLLPAGARAQAAGTRSQSCACATPAPARWSVFGSAGASLLQVTSVNGHLGPAGYATVSGDAISFGLGGHFSFGELRLGAEYLGLDAGEESTPAGQRARLEARYVLATAGWELRPLARLSVMPTLGIGRGALAVTLADPGTTALPADPAPSFDDVVASPGAGSRLTGAQWVFEPMLALELLVLRNREDRVGITIGARAGYRMAFNRPEWEYRGARASGGPVDQLEGATLRVTIGIGGR